MSCEHLPGSVCSFSLSVDRHAQPWSHTAGPQEDGFSLHCSSGRWCERTRERQERGRTEMEGRKRGRLARVFLRATCIFAPKDPVHIHMQTHTHTHFELRVAKSSWRNPTFHTIQRFKDQQILTNYSVGWICSIEDADDRMIASLQDSEYGNNYNLSGYFLLCQRAPLQPFPKLTLYTISGSILSLQKSFCVCLLIAKVGWIAG